MKKIVKVASFLMAVSLLLGACDAFGQQQALPASTIETVSSKPVEEPEHIEIPEPSVGASVYLEEGFIDIASEMIPLTAAPAMFTMAMPAATGSSVKSNDKAVIDYSNTKDGYVMVRCANKSTKTLKVQIKGPSGAQYTYNLKSNGDYEVYPLSDGNGSYQLGVFENVDGGSKYATANSATFEVKLDDEFAPFLRPNQYVNYTKESETVKKAAELVQGSKDLTEKISAVYNFVISNFTYDKDLAELISSGSMNSYLPDVDAVLKKSKGICFDYAAVMSAMLRSQGVPCKLVVGYAGDVYHAWIDAYSEKEGWINKAIYFDGKTWKLMDPTFASTGEQSSDVMKFIGDGDNYTPKYLY